MTVFDPGADSFMETFTGRKFFPFAPRPEDITIIDIAHSLSMQCRYNGHTTRFYSVAEHCCLLSDYVLKVTGSPSTALRMHLHDAPEAYICDIPKPYKHLAPALIEADHILESMIFEWAGLDPIKLPWLKEFDSRIVKDERLQVMANHSENVWKHDALQELGVVIHGWAPSEAESQFLLRWGRLSREHLGRPVYQRTGLIGWSGMEAHSDQADRRDICEVDVLGGIGLVVSRDDGKLKRDRKKSYPLPQTLWLNGKYEIRVP